MANPHFDGTPGADALGSTQVNAVPDSKTALSHDADLARPKTLAQADVQPNPNAELLKMLGPEKDFPAHEHARMREQFGLKPDASSRDLFMAIAEAGYKEFQAQGKQHNPAMRAEQEKELHALGLTRENISPATIFAAQMAQRIKETGIKDPTDYAAIELQTSKKFYADVKSGKAIPTDFD